MIETNETCGCPDPALCLRLGRHISGRLWQIWHGAAPGLSAADCEAYRRLWVRGSCGPCERRQGACPFERIVLVNLARRPDRLEASLRQLRGNRWPWPLPQVFPAVDGSRVPTPHGWKQGGGSWGCMQSHRQVVERALQEGIEPLLVLEDDLLLRPGFPELANAFVAAVPADWEGLMLGGQHIKQAVAVGPGVVQCTNTQRTHAYAVRGRWMRDLYALWCSPNAAVHCDWLMGPPMVRYRIYAPDPFLIGQRGGPSDICGRSTAGTYWTPPTGREPVILLRAARPVVEALRQRGWHTGYQRDPATDYDVGLVACVAGRRRLGDWILELQWEVTGEPMRWLCIWHPSVTLDQVRASWAGYSMEVVAGSPEEAEAVWATRPREHGGTG